MSALRMCAYGVLILPRIRDENNLPLRDGPVSNIITERAKIIGMVHEELSVDYPGWRIIPFTSISRGYGSGRHPLRPPHTSSEWNTDKFGVLAPPIKSGFGDLQPAVPVPHKRSWQDACIAILKQVERGNEALRFSS